MVSVVVLGWGGGVLEQERVDQVGLDGIQVFLSKFPGIMVNIQALWVVTD